MRAFAAMLVCLLLAGCASTARREPTAELLRDASFAPPPERISANDVFALSEPMQRFLESEINPQLQARGRQRALFDALYGRGGLRLDYDATTTRNAAQAFESRSGNCLSLVLLTAAFAKRLDLPVRFQNVYGKESWSRSDRLNVLNEHVNIVLLPKWPGDAGGMTIDFLPIADPESQRTRALTEANIVAMYMNNRAVEWLSRQELDRAYWWARAAVVEDARSLSAWNTLGVIYKAHGDLPAAERTYRWILGEEPDNVFALGNLAAVLELQGRSEEAARLSAALAKIQPTPPFHFFDLGTAAMARGDFMQARAMFAREVQRDAYYDKFHFWLGMAYYGLGDLENAREQLAIAVDNSATAGDRAFYSGKLARLRAGLPP